jgi:nicotinamidase-related amidase
MAAAALIVIDMLNPYRHEDAEPLMESVADRLPSIQELIDEAREAELQIVFVNDNFGDWSAAREQIAQRALEGEAPELVEPILPPPGTPFVVKARHSVFYETQLEYMLRQERISRLILVGQVTEQCIFYSALDGYVRHFEIVVPRDCVAHIHKHLGDAALEMMQTNMRAHVLDGHDVLRAGTEDPPGDHG